MVCGVGEGEVCCRLKLWAGMAREACIREQKRSGCGAGCAEGLRARLEQMEHEAYLAVEKRRRARVEALLGEQLAARKRPLQFGKQPTAGLLPEDRRRRAGRRKLAAAERRAARGARLPVWEWE